MEATPYQRAAEAETRLGVAVKNRSLLEQAFVHRSYLNENPGFPLESNERLEFLGDAVLGFIIAERLFQLYPHLQEGELTALRAALVRAETLAEIAEHFHLGDLLYLGKGEEATGGRTRRSTLGAMLEAIIGAVYLDRGVRTARAFVLRLWEPHFRALVTTKAPKDPKSRLQELTQSETGLAPTYQVLSIAGPEHARTFVIAACLGERTLGIGSGRSKRQAEQAAASQALMAWEEGT